MVFSCSLCQTETCYVSSMCDECSKIRRIIGLYGRTEVLDILTRVCIRDNEKREYKIRSELGDESYIKQVKWINKNEKGESKQ
jgi:hypothetical protein